MHDEALAEIERAVEMDPNDILNFILGCPTYLDLWENTGKLLMPQKQDSD